MIFINGYKNYKDCKDYKKYIKEESRVYFFRVIRSILITIIVFVIPTKNLAAINMAVLSNNSSSRNISELSSLLSERTSINDLANQEMKSSQFNQLIEEPMIWVEDIKLILSNNRLKPESSWWLKRGGFMVIMQGVEDTVLNSVFSSIGAKVESVDLNSELMRSYYLLTTLPVCSGVQRDWKVVLFDERISAVVIPYDYLGTILSYLNTGRVCNGINGKNLTRSFINIMLVSLTTDYKNDQTHLPEILKRLR